MKFTVINSEKTAREQGYKFDTTAALTIDQEVVEEFKAAKNDPNGNRLSSKIDEFYDFDSEVYQGEDGRLYAVKKVYINDCWKILCWLPIIKDEGACHD